MALMPVAAMLDGEAGVVLRGAVERVNMTVTSAFGPMLGTIPLMMPWRTEPSPQVAFGSNCNARSGWPAILPTRLSLILSWPCANGWAMVNGWFVDVWAESF